ncbi:MAG: hypothetical protein CMF72_24700 [Mameliella sp.]|nr:hypothetical protein [Mameliella sp.]|tara:strand:+ start:1741 stop:2415 length:675 start_codon:yes stop_codon:yes gene_type:complete
MRFFNDGLVPPGRVAHEQVADFSALDTLPSWLTFDTTIVGGTAASMGLENLDTGMGVARLNTQALNTKYAYLRRTRPIDLSVVKAVAVTIEGAALSANTEANLSLDRFGTGGGLRYRSRTTTGNGSELMVINSSPSVAATRPLPYIHWSAFSSTRVSRNFTMLYDCRDRSYALMMDDQVLDHDASAIFADVPHGPIYPGIRITSIGAVVGSIVLQRIKFNWWTD